VTGGGDVLKGYKKIIRERYDKQRYDSRGIMGDRYSIINPVGFYGEFKAAQILSNFVNMLIKNGTPLGKIKICDCGCGDGVKTRFLAELLGNPAQVYGVELSKNRLRHCKSMNAFIHYGYGDLTGEGGVPFDVQFDGAMAFVVFMHFSSEGEIMGALRNIYNSLKRGGLFLWYDLNAKSHWEGKGEHVGHWGFSAGEMDKYAVNAGFRLVGQSAVFTRVPIFHTPTVYLAKKVKGIWILEMLEKLPLEKNNLVRVYRKE